jgi:hypothetical protein
MSAGYDINGVMRPGIFKKNLRLSGTMKSTTLFEPPFHLSGEQKTHP